MKHSLSLTLSSNTTTLLLEILCGAETARQGSYTNNTARSTELEYNGSAPSLEPTVAATLNMEVPGVRTWSSLFLQNRAAARTNKDLFYFKFSSSEARQAVLEEGTIFISGHCLIISPWTRGMEKQRTQIITVPQWIKIHNVPKELWTDDGLGFLASKVGVPHSQDEATKLKKRIDYARVCVEVDVLAKLPDSFPIELAPRDERLISFEYPWIPAR
ncbi:hypothetical protein IFM89_027266 [Coptis chinensis]|uniref:DUF4283 domain-containing protein n=1 Tax=Coptis chinensis TaxID=261450 RepID=A0A835GY37_9MAGN|nr:hypothetical protein IFM89_027266 [Coptis chinensis]